MLGFKSPFEESIPRTKVAESADVTKKVHSRRTAIREITFPRGIVFITTKNAVSVTFIASAATVVPALIPIVPNIANHRNDHIAGTKLTPIINSLIVLPFDILAIKTPTNGAQAIHHAQ